MEIAIWFWVKNDIEKSFVRWKSLERFHPNFFLLINIESWSSLNQTRPDWKEIRNASSKFLQKKYFIIRSSYIVRTWFGSNVNSCFIGTLLTSWIWSAAIKPYWSSLLSTLYTSLRSYLKLQIGEQLFGNIFLQIEQCWWSRGQNARLLRWRSEFVFRWSLQFLCNFLLKRTKRGQG